MSYQKFTKDVGLIGLTDLLIGLKTLIILPIMTKMLDAENYGIWAQMIVTINLVAPIATLGLPFALVRFLAAEKEKEEIQEGIYSVLTAIFIVGLIISLILIIFSYPISNFFGCGQNLIKILAFVILLECLNLVFLNIFRAFQEIKKYSFFIIFLTVGEVGLIAAAVSLGHRLLGAILSLLIIRLATFLIVGALIIKKVGIKFPNFSRIKDYLSFGLPIVPSNISSWVVQSSDRYLIGYFLGAVFVGYYAPGYTLGCIVSLFVAPLGFVLPVVLSKFYDENKMDKVKTYFEYSLKYFLMFAIPSAFGLSILSKQLLTILSTPEIASQGYLVTPFVVLSILLYGTYAIISQIIVLVKKTKIIGTIWIIAAITNFGLNLIFIPKIGILGAAITTLLAYFLAFLLTWHYSFQNFKFDIGWKFILKSLSASIVMSLFIIRFSPVGILEVSIAIIISVLLYSIVLFLLKGFTRNELKFFVKLFK